MLRNNDTNKNINLHCGQCFEYNLDRLTIHNRLEGELSDIENEPYKKKVDRKSFFDTFFNLKKLLFKPIKHKGEYYLTYNAATKQYVWKEII